MEFVSYHDETDYTRSSYVWEHFVVSEMNENF